MNGVGKNHRGEFCCADKGVFTPGAVLKVVLHNWRWHKLKGGVLLHW